MRYLLLLVLLPLALTLVLSIVSCSVPKLGLRDGQLLPCPTTPNCVSSLSPKSDTGHHVEPLSMHNNQESTMIGLRAIIAEMPRTLILEETGDYLRVQFTTQILRFKDDVEFHLVTAGDIVHIRSASRVGYSDFGANRKRVEMIRTAWNSWRSRQ
ncbi:MAG: DUF1499 domain-containing protein [Planctomycetota bacterium]|nr:DUF1499 domain-containing protein [Planctomycetota bacterium]